jgi:hypothetical protein
MPRTPNKITGKKFELKNATLYKHKNKITDKITFFKIENFML